MRILFTGPEAAKSGVPFLLDSEMQLITAANAWLRKLSQDGATSSPHTLRAYAYALCDFFKYLEAHGYNWLNVTNDMVTSYRDVQDQNPSPHTKRSLKRRTINNRLMVIGWFYSFAEENGFIASNPIKYKKLRIHRPTDSDMLAHLERIQIREAPLVVYERLALPRVKWRPHHEVMKWLNSIEVWSHKLLGKITYRAGLRRDEVVNLSVSQLPQRSSIDVSRPEVSFSIMGKGGKERMIYLPTRDVLELHDYIAIERAPLVKKAKAKHDKIFVTENGLPYKPNQLNRIFDAISKKCKIKITPHMLRHSFAVVALSFWRSIGLSQPEKLLQARLGHTRITTTQIYMHLTDEIEAEEAKANASLIEMFLRGEIVETK